MITHIGNSVVAEIDASDLLLPFGENVSRKILPKLDLEATATLQVQIVNPSFTKQRINRGKHFQNTFTVQIGLLQLLPTYTPADVDAMTDLVEDLANLRYADVLDGAREATYLGTELVALFDADKLEEKNQFVSVHNVQFVEFQGP